MLDSWVRVKDEGVGQVYAVCDDLPGKSLLVNLKNGKSEWFKTWNVEFLNGPPKEVKNQDQAEEETADKGKRNKRRRKVQA